jgi:hypothetical protein
MSSIRWRQIPNFSAYEASDSGLVRSIKTGKTLKSKPNDGGYLRVTIKRDDGKRVRPLIHVLVLMAWRGPRPSPRHHGAHCHCNDKRNNRLENLEWKLPEENEADKKIHGTAPRGGRVWRPSKARIERIRARAAAGESYTKIGLSEGLHRSSVSRIVRGLRRAEDRGGRQNASAERSCEYGSATDDAKGRQQPHDDREHHEHGDDGLDGLRHGDIGVREVEANAYNNEDDEDADDAHA